MLACASSSGGDANSENATATTGSEEATKDDGQQGMLSSAVQLVVFAGFSVVVGRASKAYS